jgi:S-formylglutathione hydrolase
MGGNGALVVALKSAGWASCSAFAPISDPTTSGFGADIVSKYFGGDKAAAEQYSSVCIIKAKLEAGVAAKDIICPTMCDTGTSDNFEHLLNTPLLRNTAAAAGLNLKFRMQAGYDHSYNFITTFIEEHMDFHALYLKTA